MPYENSPSPKRILITYATAGAGHKRAAMAIGEALEQRAESIDARCIDLLDFASPLFAKMYPKTYLFLVQKLSGLWGFGYGSLDHPLIWKIVEPLRRIWNCLIERKFLQYLRKEQPDVVVATHFMSADIVGYAKKKGWVKTKLVIVITDMHPHRIWLTPEADAVVVSNQRGKDVCIERGVAADNIHILGIPVSAAFSKQRDLTQLRSKWNVAQDARVILVISGGTTVGKFEEMVEHCMQEAKQLDIATHIFVVCGENQAAAERLKRKAATLECTAEVFGFINTVDEIMAMADFVIAKAGGLLVTEALVSNTPLIIYHAIPGQEAYNAYYMSQDGAAVIEKDSFKVAMKMKALLEDKESLDRMKAVAHRLANPDSAQMIAQTTMTLI